MGLAVAGVVLAAAGATARAQDAKQQDSVLEELIKQQLEDKKRASEQAQKDGAKQGAETPEQRLARAKLLAESEHDYENALALAQKVEQDGKNPSDLRAQALVVASRCLNQIGRTEEARTYLKRAARMNGPAADEAKRLLAGGLADPQLELRIAKAIEQLFGNVGDPILKPSNLASSQNARDLIWVGAPAVPRLAKILADADQLASVTAAACLLGNIGTPEAAVAIREALQRSDPLYRRAVIRGFEAMIPKEEHQKFWEGPVREAALSLLKDRDTGMRESQLVEHQDLATVGELLEMTSDPEDKVRIAAWNALYGRYSGHARDSSGVDAIVPALRRCMKEDHDPVRQAACSLFWTEPIRRDADGRELAFESMLDPVLTGADLVNMPRWMSGYSAANQTFLSRPIPIDLLVRVAQRFEQDAIATANPLPRLSRASHNALAMWISNSSGIPIGSTERYGWPATERATVWTLLRLGYGDSVAAWTLSNATAEDVPTIVENCVEAGHSNLVLNLLPQRIKSLTGEQRESIARSLVRATDASRDGLVPTDKSRVAQLRAWCQALVTVGVPYGDEALIRIVEASVLPGNRVAWDIVSRVTPEVDLRLLPRLVVLDTRPDSSNEASLGRNAALGRLAAAHSTDLPKLLATCYGLGLWSSKVQMHGSDSSRPRGIAWMLTRDLGGDVETAARLREERRAIPAMRKSTAANTAAEWGPTYSAADVRGALEDCARSGGFDFWWDVKTAIDLLPIDGPFDPVATTVLEITTRLVASAPLVNDKEPHQVVGSLLERRAPGWEDLAVANVLDARWKDPILKWLPEVTPGLLDRLASVHDPIGISMRRSIVGRLADQVAPSCGQRRIVGAGDRHAGTLREQRLCRRESDAA